MNYVELISAVSDLIGLLTDLKELFTSNPPILIVFLAFRKKKRP